VRARSSGPPARRPAITVRSATAADAPALGQLGALLVRTHHDFDPVRFIAPTRRTERGYASWLRRQLPESSVVVLVAERADEVLGYAYAAIEGPDYMALRGPAGVLYDLAVDPAHRGQGVGRALLEAAVAELARRGAPRVVLATAARNAGAQRLFVRAGFRPTMIEMTRELGGDAP
jgi:ribosomal protein S18 acetylase RimI-like enzyme